MHTLQAERFAVGFPTEAKAFSPPKRPALSLVPPSLLLHGYKGPSHRGPKRTERAVNHSPTCGAHVNYWSYITSTVPIHFPGVDSGTVNDLLTTGVVNRVCVFHTLTNNDTEEQN